MSDPKKTLTPAELEEMRALAEAATPGPWVRRPHPFGDSETHGCVKAPSANGILVAGATVIARNEDCEFIAHARTGVPRLLAHVEALEAEKLAIVAAGDKLAAALARAEADRDGARAALAAKPKCDTIRGLLAEAVAAEREACWQACDDVTRSCGASAKYAVDECKRRIRARGSR
jgi:hypothetical protein